MDRLPRFRVLARFGIALSAGATTFAGCGSSASSPAPSGYIPAATLAIRVAQPRGYLARPSVALRQDAGSKIKHVVIIMQENRSFNYLFMNYPGATTQSFGYDSHGTKITLQPISLAAPYDIDHQSFNTFEACNGSPPGQNCQMNGFNNEDVGGSYGPNPEYGYAPPSEVQPYWNMASQYVLADNMFTSNLDASFVSHQYIIAGQANRMVDLPNTNWGCGGGSGDSVLTLNNDRTYGSRTTPCQNYQTLGDELSAKRLNWRYYADSPTYLWSAYQAVSHIFYGPAWKHVVTPSSQVLTDVGQGKLASMTWVLPSWTNSDHGYSQSTSGPPWVASVVNAVGNSKYWKSTAIFIFWDEWGGWYDPVPPPYIDYDGLGLRVPMLIISPYAKQGYVTHVQYEHGSMLRFVEDLYGLPQLAASDQRANDPMSDAFNFSQPPRPFNPFATTLSESYFVHQPASMHPIDDK